jgi:hypothetical protein
VDTAVVVAVTVVRVVKVPGHEIIDVPAVRDGFVPAAGTVSMASGVPAACVRRRARRRVRGRHPDGAFVDVPVVGPMQMPLVDVVRVPVVLNGHVAAPGAVRMRVLHVNAVLAHYRASAACS